MLAMDHRRTPDADNGSEPAVRPREVTIRIAGDEDAAALTRIAERDTRPLPDAPVLLAICDGTLMAGISLVDGAVVADPFHRTAAIVELLRCHAVNRRAPGLSIARARRVKRRPLRRLGVAGGCA
jgi:hypothetical protein